MISGKGMTQYVFGQVQVYAVDHHGQPAGLDTVVHELAHWLGCCRGPGTDGAHWLDCEPAAEMMCSKGIATDLFSDRELRAMGLR